MTNFNIKGVTKYYFIDMLKYKFLQEIIKEQEDLHEELMQDNAHTNDPDYANYLKQKYLAYTDLIHYLSNFK